MKKLLTTMTLAILLMFSVNPAVFASEEDGAARDESAGIVIAPRGTLTAVDQNGQVRKLTRRSKFYANETLKTGAGSEAQLRFTDGAFLTLKSDSELNIGQYHFGGAEDPANTVVMKLLAGGFRAISGSIGKSNKLAYRVETPAASIGIRGTEYEVVISPDGKVVVNVISGSVTVQTAAGTVTVGPGQTTTIVTGSAPSAPATTPTSTTGSTGTSFQGSFDVGGTSSGTAAANAAGQGVTIGVVPATNAYSGQ